MSATSQTQLMFPDGSRVIHNRNGRVGYVVQTEVEDVLRVLWDGEGESVLVWFGELKLAPEPAIELLAEPEPAPVADFIDPIPSFPAELKALDRWCVYGRGKKIEEDGRPDKTPYDARTGRQANTAAGRTDFLTCVAALPDYHGLGFGPEYEDGYTMVDFDHCVDPTTHELDPRVLQVVREVSTYGELSPTGTGVHLFVKGWQVPDRKGHKVGKAEIYSGGHYFTVTGNQIPGTPSTVENRDLSKLFERILSGEFDPNRDAKSVPASSPLDVTVRVPRGQHDILLTRYAGVLRDKGLNADEMEPVLIRYVEEKFDDFGSDYREMARKVAQSIGRKPAGNPDPGVRIGGNLPGQAPAQGASSETKEQLVQQAKDAMAQQQRDFEKIASECEEKSSVDPNPYPMDAWKDTPYLDFANLCTGKGTAYPNFIPGEFCVNTLMTVVGAIAGHRIHPRFSKQKVDGRFYTVLLTKDGGIGKGTVFDWSTDMLFAGTGGLLYSGGTVPFVNIGAYVGDFGSARGLLDTFMQHPRILQIYDELGTAFEKFGITGSGTSFKDIQLNLLDSTTPRWSVTKESKVPKDAPKNIYNSLLGSTTTSGGRYDEMFSAAGNDDTLRQRINLIPTEENRTVAVLADPDFTEFRKTILPKIYLLNSYELLWDYSPEAQQMLADWHEKNVRDVRERDDKAEKESWGRVQTHIHHIICHLALWLAPVPDEIKKDNGLLFDEVTGWADLINKGEGEDTKTEGEDAKDKIWEVTVPASWMERALQIAEYQVKARQDNTPPEGRGQTALCENLIVKHMSALRTSRWFHLSRKANLNKFGYDVRTKALYNMRSQGLLHIEVNPEAPTDQRQWCVVWVGDGRHVKKWGETRGGARPGSGRKTKIQEDSESPQEGRP